MDVIEVKKLKKYFGNVHAVDNVSFSVAKGEIFGFLGPNGAGKTTAIRCMMDFARTTSGEIIILGKDSRLDSVFLKSKIGYLSDTSRFYDHWSAERHIDFQESLRGTSRGLFGLIKEFDLNPKLRFANLSSGNKRKLAIILALMNDPEILILDEPTTALDPLLQAAFHQYIRKFAADGGTVFMSSHNLSEVEKICDRAGIIKNGRMVAVEKISDMRLTKIYNIAFQSDHFETKELSSKNAEIVSQVNGLVVLKVKGDINPVLADLSKIKINDIEITHVSLEDIFMEFYQK